MSMVGVYSEVKVTKIKSLGSVKGKIMDMENKL